LNGWARVLLTKLRSRRTTRNIKVDQEAKSVTDGNFRAVNFFMKLLVIGSGGREHALVWKLVQSPHATQMWCAPGNAGIAQETVAQASCLSGSTHGQDARSTKKVECVNIGAEDLPKLLAFAQEKKIDFTIVGPDNPLALGIVDLFQKQGLKIWGVNQKAAQFESSKVFSQKRNTASRPPPPGRFRRPGLQRPFAPRSTANAS
jgi:phosphoribosylamine--glycine ligase